MYFRIGVRAHDYGRKTPRELAADISAAGFSSVQLAISKAITGMESDIGRLTPGLAFEIGQAFASNGIDIAVLGCYIEPVHPDESQRALHIQRFKEHLLYARAMGGLVVGTETTMFRGPESERDAAFSILLHSVEQLLTEAEKSGAVVGIEPVAVHTLNTPALTRRLLDTFKSEHIKIIFDPVNLIRPAIVEDHSALLDECFDAFGDQIIALHCKDIVLNAEGKITEVLLGEGKVNYPKLAGYLKTARPGLALLREGANPQTAQKDIDFLKSTFCA